MRVVFAQVGFCNLIIFQHNCPRALAKLQGAESDERPVQRRKQRNIHGKTQNGAACYMQAQCQLSSTRII